MAKKNFSTLILVIFLLAPIFLKAPSTANAAPYNIFNYGVGFGPIPIEVGMSGEIVGGYSLQYDPSSERGYAIFRIRNSTNIIFEKIFLEQGSYIEKYIAVSISPEEFTPGPSGSLTFAELSLVVENTAGKFYDNSTVWFYVQKALPNCTLKDLKILGNGEVNAIFQLYNKYNSSYKVRDLTVSTQIIANNVIIAENVSRTDQTGLFNIKFTPTQENRDYTAKIISSENDCYRPNTFNIELTVNNVEQPNSSISAAYLLLIIPAIAAISIGLVRYRKKKDLAIS